MSVAARAETAPLSDAAIVEAYLTASMIPDPDAAAAYMAPGTVITFTGGREFDHPRGPTGFNAKRYRWVKKKMDRFDVCPGDGETIVIASARFTASGRTVHRSRATVTSIASWCGTARSPKWTSGTTARSASWSNGASTRKGYLGARAEPLRRRQLPRVISKVAIAGRRGLVWRLAHVWAITAAIASRHESTTPLRSSRCAYPPLSWP